MDDNASLLSMESCSDMEWEEAFPEEEFGKKMTPDIFWAKFTKARPQGDAPTATIAEPQALGVLEAIARENSVVKRTQLS